MSEPPGPPTAPRTIRHRWRFAIVLVASLSLAVAQPLTSGLFDERGSFDVFCSLLIAAVLLLVFDQREHRRIAASLGLAALLGVWVSHGPGGLVGQLLSNLGLHFATDATAAYVVGAALVLALIFLLGAAVDAGAKSLVQRLLDATVQRIPIIGSVYGTSKQVVGIVDRKGDANLNGMRAVFCCFGGASGVGVLAFLVSPERLCLNGRSYHIVIVPTAPVPVGGGLLFVPAEMVQPADVSVEGLMSIYVSMGVTAPQFLPQAVCSEHER